VPQPTLFCKAVACNDRIDEGWSLRLTREGDLCYIWKEYFRQYNTITIMNASSRIIIKDVVVLGAIAATIYFNGFEITNFIFTTFGFIDDINPNMGWVALVLSAIWLVCSFKGNYKSLAHPFFYVSFIYWFFFFFGGIDTNLGLNIAMAILATPYIYALKQWMLICNAAKKNTSIFKYDHFEKGKQLHEGRSEMVDLITTEVKKLYNEKHSFTIGLEGGWGSGKSTLLNAVIEKLKGDNDEHGLRIEVVEFSPWAFPDGKKLSVEFLYEIRRVLIKHSFRARFVVNSYINVLTGNYSLGPLRMLTSLLFPRESLTDVKRKLSEIICHHKLKLVVIIDDLDRLDKTEIAEVFKMLRNTGELANSVYLVAYDRLKIEEMDTFCNGFLDKIINVEVDLNPFDSISLLEEVLKEIYKLKLPPNKCLIPNSRLGLYLQKRHSDLLIDFSNPRDAKRLMNSLRVKLCILSKDWEKEDENTVEPKISMSFLLFLEMVKLKDYRLYLDIKNQRIYVDSSSAKIKTDYHPMEIAAIDQNGKNHKSWNNQYFNRLKEYLVVQTKNDDTDTDPTIDYIQRADLGYYFVSSGEEKRVYDIIGSYLAYEEPLLPEELYEKDAINNKHLLNSWKVKENLYNRVIMQVPIVLEEAEKKNKTHNYGMLVANLILIKKYLNYGPLFYTLKIYCINYGTGEMFKYINKNRIEAYSETEITNELNRLDEFYNKLIESYHKKIYGPLDSFKLKILLSNQKERMERLINQNNLIVARQINCVKEVNPAENKLVLSDDANTLLRKYAQVEPLKYFTELAFYEENDGKIRYNRKCMFLENGEHFGTYAEALKLNTELALLFNELYKSIDHNDFHPILNSTSKAIYSEFTESLKSSLVETKSEA
jgi:hypothetical protein